MKSLAISFKGMEDITALEIKEILGVDSTLHNSCVEFECSDEDLAKYCYKAQGANRVLALFDSFNIKDYKDMKRISKIDFSKYLNKKTFAARAYIIENELITKEVECTTGEYIEGKVDLKNPDVVIFAFVCKNDCYVGIDFSGDISKRDYKIYTTRDDIRGTLAYALVRLSGYSSEKSFMNLNAKSGTIAIEAALFGSGKSPRYFNKDKLLFNKFLKIDLSKFDSKEKKVNVFAFDSSGYQKVISNNAKIAGVEVKLEKKESDCAVRYHNKRAEIKGLAKEREIKHGKEVLKVLPYSI